MFLQIEHKLLPKDSDMHFTPSTEQQQHRAPKHRAGAAPSTQHQARAPSTKHPAPSTKHTAAAAAAAARFPTRTGEPTQLPNGSRRERGGHHPLIRLKSCENLQRGVSPLCHPVPARYLISRPVILVSHQSARWLHQLPRCLHHPVSYNLCDGGGQMP